MDLDQSPQNTQNSMIGSSDQLVSHGAEIEKLNEPLILYCTRREAIGWLHKRFKLVLLFFVPYAAFVLLVEHNWLVVCGLAAWIAFMYIWQMRAHTKSISPVIEMRPEGLVVHSMLTDFQLIQWNEIKEARAYRCIYQSVGIVPYDLKKTLARGSIAAQMIGWNNVVWAPIYRLFGCFLAPINIPEQYLPLSATDVAEQINLRRLRAVGQNRDEPLTIRLTINQDSKLDHPSEP
jgi:hypothetical protein